MTIPLPVREAFRKPRTVEESAGGVLVRLGDEGWHALVIRDSYGKWGLPKGHLEHGEGVRQAAVREVEEETGLKPDAVGPRLDTLRWTFGKHGQKISKYCTFFLMRSEQGTAVPQTAEGITECRWLPIAEAAEKIAYPNTRVVVRRAAAVIDEIGW